MNDEVKNAVSYGIATLSIIPCRAEPSDKAEMVTQLLFGEHYQVLEETEKWCHIVIQHDGYECWIDKKQFHEISTADYDQFSANDFPRASALTNTLTINNQPSTVTPGTLLPFLHNNKVKIRKNEYAFEGTVAEPTTDNMIASAMLFINAPYLWGGRTPFGIDCSGFSQIVYAMCGIAIQRDAYQQAEEGETIQFVDAVKAGDLAFFDNAEGRITHVGIAMDGDTPNEKKIIHASGKVRIDTLDHNGIFNADTGSYSHQLRIIKRLF
jgi:cell wall-associated NlpC family hydrolase